VLPEQEAGLPMPEGDSPLADESPVAEVVR
jgi:hypothetical protein